MNRNHGDVASGLFFIKWTRSLVLLFFLLKNIYWKCAKRSVTDERMVSTADWKRTKTAHTRVLIDRLDMATYICEYQTSWNPQNKAFWKMMSHLSPTFYLRTCQHPAVLWLGNFWKGRIFRDYGSFRVDSLQAEQFCFPKPWKAHVRTFKFCFRICGITQAWLSSGLPECSKL